MVQVAHFYLFIVSANAPASPAIAHAMRRAGGGLCLLAYMSHGEFLLDCLNYILSPLCYLDGAIRYFLENTMALDMDPNTISTIISNINGLYNNLVSYTVGLILFVGAFVPAVISFFQRRQFKQEYEDLSAKMTDEIRLRVKEAEENLRTFVTATQAAEIENLKRQNEELKRELTKQIGTARAAGFHNQANQQSGHNPRVALESCNWALPLYLEGKDEANAKAIIKIVLGALPTLSAAHAKERDEIENVVEGITDTLGLHDENGRYRLELQDIRRALKEARARMTAGAPVSKPQ
ncbi:MAG TPA: hypothetical protein VIU93_11215 [Gallionellaceae bacterium]